MEISRQFLPPTVKPKSRFKAVPPDLEGVSPYDWSRDDWRRVRVLSGYKPGWENHQAAYQKMHLQQEGGVAA